MPRRYARWWTCLLLPFRDISILKVFYYIWAVRQASGLPQAQIKPVLQTGALRIQGVLYPRKRFPHLQAGRCARDAGDYPAQLSGNTGGSDHGLGLQISERRSVVNV